MLYGSEQMERSVLNILKKTKAEILNACPKSQTVFAVCRKVPRDRIRMFKFKGYVRSDMGYVLCI